MLSVKSFTRRRAIALIAGAAASPLPVGAQSQTTVPRLTLPAEPLQRESGPMEITGDDKTIEGFTKITGGIKATNCKGLTIRLNNIEMVLGGPYAMVLTNCSGLIENIAFGLPNAPIRRLPREQKGIFLSSCSEMRINRVRAKNTGCMINPYKSQRIHISNLIGIDSRNYALNSGADPRGYNGALVQFNNSTECILEDFHHKNDLATAGTSDNVSVFKSTNIVVRRGIVDGSTDPAGVGVMVEDGSSALVQDVDALNMSNGSFSTYDKGSIATFERCRSRDLYRPVVAPLSVEDPSGKWVFSESYEPMSGGVHFTTGPGSSAAFIACVYHGPGQVAWKEAFMTRKEFRNEDFVPRQPIALTGFPFD